MKPLEARKTKRFKICDLKFAIRNSSRGFTLIEVAMVLIILGILVGLGAALVGPLTKQAKFSESREVVKAAKEAVSGYAVKNGYLPANLEAAGARKLDAWGNDLVLYRATEFDASPENACGVTSTTLGGQPFEVHECTNDDCSTYNTKSNVGFVVFSKGPDANEAGTDPNKDGIPPFKVRIQDSSYTDGATTYNYDDIVAYVPLDEIRSARGCSFTITTQSLPDAKTGVPYNVTGVQLQASGGQTPYTSWTVTAGALPAGITLSSPGGLISETPTTAGVYNFTVTLTDVSSVTTSKAFTLNVIDSCFSPGIYVVNATGGTRYYKRNNSSTRGTGCTSWTTTTPVNVQPVDILYPFTAAGCATRACTASHPAPNYLSYNVLQGTDVNDNCSISWRVYGAAKCTFADF